VGTWAGLHGFWSLHMHGLMALTALLATVLFLDWLGRPRRGWLVLPALGLALTGLTLETAVLIWGGLFATALFWRSTHADPAIQSDPVNHADPADHVDQADPAVWSRLRSVLPVFGLALAIVVVLWFGGVAKASPLRTAANYAYRVRLGSEYATVTSRLPGIARACLPILLLGTMAVGARLFTGVRLSKRSRAFLAIGALYGIVILPVALSETYLIPAGVLLAVPCLAALAHVRGVVARAAILLATVISLAASSPPIGAGDADASLRDDYQWLASGGRLERQVLWADGGHILAWYFPQARVRPITVSYDGASLTERDQGRYRPLSAADIGADLVLVEASRGGRSLDQTDGPLAGCPRTARPSFVLYDCGRRVVR
jgi:hypothetical protein